MISSTTARSVFWLTRNSGTQLEAEREVGASLNPDRETSLSIYESAEIGLEPSLLIVRIT